MAGIKESFSKGLTTLNVKTSGFMEQSKYKTQISTLDGEISVLINEVGQRYYALWSSGAEDASELKPLLEQIKNKKQLIDELNAKIDEVQQNEQKILGRPGGDQGTAVRYCVKCGAQNIAGDRFCRTCGAELVKG